ncbi:rhodanese-like domain-containing protein [Nocardioides mesophilus]|uniref:rhodanese-like domain-containing protein n=1 Tax=Nocardioides mesophilus TaxID=433659 RepID=UPI001CB70285|nr:rhodanese-like domain-containing protein [Nocardioides mesophilus]
MSLPLRLVVAVLALLLLGSVTACSSETASGADGSTGRTVEPAEARALIEHGAVVIDVRTPEEFAEGHLEGALNLDLQNTDFFDQLGDLDPDDTFVVYCRSGSRAAAAIEQMVSRGFEDVVNAGGFDALEAAGIATQ